MEGGLSGKMTREPEVVRDAAAARQKAKTRREGELGINALGQPGSRSPGRALQAVECAGEVAQWPLPPRPVVACV